MSKQHPVVALTGASGAGTSTAKRAFEHIFKKENIKAGIVEGDSFHRYNRAAMRERVAESKQFYLRVFTHYCEQANYLDKLAALFEQYGNSGTGEIRYYAHNSKEAQKHNIRLGIDIQPGNFTPWETLPAGTDLLFYEGLHGGAVTRTVNVAQHVDLLVGVVPCINLEWMQKIWRDSSERPYTPEQVTEVILERMPDYVKYIAPQFDRTHINFHRVPLVDTGNPFSIGNAKAIPAPENSLVIITVRKDLLSLQSVLNAIEGSQQTSEQTVVVPGQHMSKAMELALKPAIQNLLGNKF